MSWTPPRHSRGKWRNGPRKRKERYVGGGSLDIAMTRASSNNDDNMKDNARVKKKKQLLAALSSRPEMGTKGKEGRKCKRQERERENDGVRLPPEEKPWCLIVSSFFSFFRREAEVHYWPCHDPPWQSGRCCRGFPFFDCPPFLFSPTGKLPLKAERESMYRLLICRRTLAERLNGRLASSLCERKTAGRRCNPIRSKTWQQCASAPHTCRACALCSFVAPNRRLLRVLPGEKERYNRTLDSSACPSVRPTGPSGRASHGCCRWLRVCNQNEMTAVIRQNRSQQQKPGTLVDVYIYINRDPEMELKMRLQKAIGPERAAVTSFRHQENEIEKDKEKEEEEDDDLLDQEG